MERLSGHLVTPARLRGAIMALGNFDGFHSGHQAVVGRAVAQAAAAGRPAIVATFDPHPVRYFRPDAPPFRLTTLDQRAALFAAAGADAMLTFAFDETLASVSADDFVTDWLGTRAGAAGVVTGEDFTFGKGRGGSVPILRATGHTIGLTCEAVGPVCDDSGVISSSRIRAALQAGDCATATRLLTRPFSIEGVVQHGDKVGRTLGYPTANLDLGQMLRPRYGIYAVRARLHDGRTLDGVANLGIRPTFTPPRELFEPHFFDFNENLYGQTIAVSLIAFLRGEARFDTMDALVAQMDEDAAQARRILLATPAAG
jgi:riboflavin kinase / FMN adenylyltransferase